MEGFVSLIYNLRTCVIASKVSSAAVDKLYKWDAEPSLCSVNTTLTSASRCLITLLSALIWGRCDLLLVAGGFSSDWKQKRPRTHKSAAQREAAEGGICLAGFRRDMSQADVWTGGMVVKFPPQICAILKWWNTIAKCVSTEWCCATKNMFYPLVSSHSKKRGGGRFTVWQLHFHRNNCNSLSLLLIKGSVGVLPDLCWKGKPLVRGSDRVCVRDFWIVYICDFAEELWKRQNVTRSTLDQLRDAVRPLAAPATSWPGEPWR